MTTTRSSTYSSSDSVAARVKRSPRAAAVEARERVSAVMAEETVVTYVHVPLNVPSPSARVAPANHRYMLRSMRR